MGSYSIKVLFDKKKKFEEYFAGKIYEENSIKKINQNYKYQISSELKRIAKYSNLIANQHLRLKSQRKKLLKFWIMVVGMATFHMQLKIFLKPCMIVK